jgi:cyanate lyase
MHTSIYQKLIEMVDAIRAKDWGEKIPTLPLIIRFFLMLIV